MSKYQQLLSLETTWNICLALVEKYEGRGCVQDCAPGVATTSWTSDYKNDYKNDIP